jgi:hypothetical protein
MVQAAKSIKEQRSPQNATQYLMPGFYRETGLAEVSRI